MLMHTDECSRLTSLLDENTKAIKLLIGENHDLKTKYEDIRAKATYVESENKTLTDRWKAQKLKESEHLNEVNALYEDILNKQSRRPTSYKNSRANKSRK
ncbi:hypothetical protein LXL04_009466 [Taraxacum kok-saghyz]